MMCCLVLTRERELLCASLCRAGCLHCVQGCMGLHELPLFAAAACMQFCYGVLLSFILAAL